MFSVVYSRSHWKIKTKHLFRKMITRKSLYPLKFSLKIKVGHLKQKLGIQHLGRHSIAILFK